jgi:hypothetical protein
MLASGHTVPPPEHAVLGISSDGIVAAQVAHNNSSDSAQQEWLHLFKRPNHHNYRQNKRVAWGIPPVPKTLPATGCDHEVVETQPWSRDIVYIYSLHLSHTPRPSADRHTSKSVAAKVSADS